MVYVFDSGPLIHLFEFYYKSTFKSLWEKFDIAVDKGMVTSVREVKRELETNNTSADLNL